MAKILQLKLKFQIKNDNNLLDVVSIYIDDCAFNKKHL